MGLFRKNKKADKAHDDKELISENERAVDALIVLADKNDEIVDEFRALKEKIKYLIASENDKVYDYDKKIRNLIDDLRIVLVKRDGEMNEKAQKLVTQIKLAIADRNAKL